MKNHTILSVVIGLVCYADVSATAPPNLRGRGLRKDPETVAGNDFFEEACVDLGKRKGLHTFIVRRDEANWFNKTIRRTRGATKGACKKVHKTNLSERQQTVEAFCCNFGPNDKCTLYAPKAVRGWLYRRGVRRGKCKNETGPDVEMKLQELGDKNTIIGYKWQATEILWEDNDSVGQTLDDSREPITIFFESREKVHGNAGCNNCFGNLALFTDTQFRITYLGTMKIWCHP